MAVKRSQSAARVLAVLENVASYQPIGVSDLARLMDTDKSAVHRALMTLADAGWIQAAGGRSRGWELTSRIQDVVQVANSHHDLRERARRLLKALRDQTGETATLNVIERDRFVVSDVVESRHMLRVVLTAGAGVPALHSATGRAILPFLSRERQIAILGAAPDQRELDEYAATIRRGYSISSEIVVAGFANVAAPVFEADGRVVGAIVVTGPADRMKPEAHETLGAMVRQVAEKLARGEAAGAAAA